MAADPTGFKVDLTNCEREPIHILGNIQPFGFLVAVGTDWLIARVSANVEQFTGKTADELLGQPLTASAPSRSAARSSSSAALSFTRPSCGKAVTWTSSRSRQRSRARMTPSKEVSRVMLSMNRSVRSVSARTLRSIMEPR